MRDGFTRKLEVPERNASFDEFLAKWRICVVVLSGDSAGTEFEMESPCVSLGRGAEADWSFEEDETMSKEHAAIEFSQGGLRLRDLGSMNGTRHNGSEVKAADLTNGDRFQIGEHLFQIVLEKRKAAPRTYVIPDA